MRRLGQAVFATVFAALLITAVPAEVVAVNTTTALGSQHSTESEFAAAQKLDGVHVFDGDVRINRAVQVFSDSFEDSDVSEYAGSGTNTVTFGSTNPSAHDGSIRVNKTSSGSSYDPIYNSSDQFAASRNVTVSAWFYNDGDQERGGVYMATSNGAGYSAFVDPTNNIRIGRHSSGGSLDTNLITGSISLNANEWHKIHLRKDGDELTMWVEDSNGNAASAEISTTDSTHDPTRPGLMMFDVDTQYDLLQARYNEGVQSGTYISQNHSVDNAVEAKVNLTLTNAEAQVTVTDPVSQTTLGSGTFTTDGNKSISLSGQTSSKVQTNVTFINKSGTTTAQLHDESILFTNHAPAIDNSSASPTGDLTQSSQTFEIDINDTEFATAQGESLTAELYIDGSPAGTDTLSSNGTASVSATVSSGGSHSYHWEVTDSYGSTSTSKTFSINVPDELQVFNESSNTLIQNKKVNLTIYVNGSQSKSLIADRSTTNGKVDMSGLPADESLIVVAEADGYLDRRIFVPSLYETQKIYLLNSSFQHTEVIFGIQDYSGEFPPGRTVLKVQRGIGGNWETVLGDYFGANDQFTSQIRYNTRHRLVLVNPRANEEQILGTYTPLTAGSETITVSPNGTLDLPDSSPTVDLEPSTRSVPSDPNVTITSTVDNGTKSLSSWSVSMYHLNGSNTTLFTGSSTDPGGGQLSATLNLTNKTGQVKVITKYTVSGGAKSSDVSVYQISQGPAHTMTLLDGIAGMVSLIPNSDTEEVQILTALVAIVAGTTALGSVFRLSAEGMGLATLGLLTGFSIIGWVPYSLLFTALVLGAAVTFLRRGY